MGEWLKERYEDERSLKRTTPPSARAPLLGEEGDDVYRGIRNISSQSASVLLR